MYKAGGNGLVSLVWHHVTVGNSEYSQLEMNFQELHEENSPLLKSLPVMMLGSSLSIMDMVMKCVPLLQLQVICYAQGVTLHNIYAWVNILGMFETYC